MHRGYTKRWRKRWDKDYCQDQLLFTMMEYFIDHANYKDTEVFFPNIGTIPLKRGEHIFSTVKLSVKLGVGRQRIRSKLKILEKVEFLTIETTSKYSKVFVINYNIYQPSKEELNQEYSQRLTSAQPAVNQRLTIDKKDKNIKKVNKEKEVTPSTLEKLKSNIAILEMEAVFEDAEKFVYFQKQNKKDEKIICHALGQLIKKCKNGNGTFEQWSKKRAWGYCEKIINAESQIKNARDSEAEAEGHKEPIGDI